MLLCSFSLFLLRDLWTIEILSEAMSANLVGNKFSRNPSKISFHSKFIRKQNLSSVTCHDPKFTKHWNLSDYRSKSVSQEWQQFLLKRAGRCPQRLQPTRNCPVFVLARPTRTNCAGARPQKLGHWFAVKTLIVFWSSLREWWPDDRPWLELVLKLELCRLTNEL